MIPIAEWAARGYPGSVNGTTGKVNGAPPYDDWRTTPPPARRICSVPTCISPHYARGWCAKHYKNQLARGNRTGRWPSIPSSPYIKLADR